MWLGTGTRDSIQSRSPLYVLTIELKVDVDLHQYYLLKSVFVVTRCNVTSQAVSTRPVYSDVATVYDMSPLRLSDLIYRQNRGHFATGHLQSPSWLSEDALVSIYFQLHQIIINEQGWGKSIKLSSSHILLNFNFISVSISCCFFACPFDFRSLCSGSLVLWLQVHYIYSFTVHDDSACPLHSLALPLDFYLDF